MAHEGERNKCLLDKTEENKSLVFQEFRRIFPCVEGNLKITISTVLGQRSHRTSEQEFVTKGQSWDTVNGSLS